MRYVVNDPEHGPALYEEEWEASRQFDDLVTRLHERPHPRAESAFWGEVILRERLSLHATAQPDAGHGAVYAAGYERGLKAAVRFLRTIATAEPHQEEMTPAVHAALRCAADAIETALYSRLPSS